MITIMSDDLTALFDQAAVATPLTAGAVAFRAGDPVRAMYLVREGRIDLVRHTASGGRLILHSAGPGDVLAEASAYAGGYHCDGVARADSLLRAVPVAQFLAHLRANPAAAQLWAARLARGLQTARLQAEVRTLRTVAARLDAWTEVFPGLPPKGQIQDLAHTLGVTREALYRALARRRRGGG